MKTEKHWAMRRISELTEITNCTSFARELKKQYAAGAIPKRLFSFILK